MPTDSQFLDGTSDIQRLAILRSAEAQGTYISPLTDACFKDATEDVQRLEILRAIEGISGGGGGSGTVTSVTGGTGLNGGTITTTGTLSVKYGTTAETAAEGNDARLSDARIPTGSAGGDLTGTYPNPTVDGLQGRPVSNATPVNGQVLQYDGANWVPGSIPSGGSGGGGVLYYLNFNTAADAPVTNIPQTPNATKELGLVGDVTATSYLSPILSTGSYDFLASFVTDVSNPSSTAIPAGIWDFNIFVESTTTNSANEVYFKVEILKYDGVNAPTLLATSNDVYIYDPSEINQQIASVVMPQTTILATDRIVVYLYGRAHQNNNRLTFHFGGNYPSHTHSTIPSVAGTGVVKVVNGVFQSPASTIVNADVSATAAIDVSKLSGVAGTAVSNTFTSNQIVSTSSASAALRVTQLGAGESFRVEDETSPDSTAFVISNNGRVGIGVDPDANVGLSVSSSGIKFSDGSIQASSATGIKTILAQTTENVSGSVSGNEFLVTGTATLVVDGYIPPVGGIVVFASQAAPAQNGFWRIVVNNGLTQPILERPTWFSSTTTNVSPLVYITRHGTTQAGFVMALTGPLGLNIVVGTTALTVHRISGRAPTVGIVAIPSASNSTGTVGQVAVDDANNFLYVCTAANVWKRTALTTF
jgi:hypothetical protein